MANVIVSLTIETDIVTSAALQDAVFERLDGSDFVLTQKFNNISGVAGQVSSQDIGMLGGSGGGGS